MTKRLGVIPHRYAQPVFYGLKERQAMFEVVEDHAAFLAVKLRERNLDGAFLSPIDYAREYQMYRIIPDVGVVSNGESRAIVLRFREHLRTIRTLAVDPRSSSEIVLAHLVFREKYGSVPQIIPFTGTGEEVLGKADARLLVGDEAMSAVKMTNTLDLVEEWKDITGMPFVHGIWVARENALALKEMSSIAECALQGSKHRKNLSRGTPPGYFKQFQYSLPEDAVAALAEFFRMAYYHGVLHDIPDTKFHALGEKQASPGH